MKKAVLYIRGKEYQEKNLERLIQQRNDLQEYCKQNSIEVLRVFSDTSNESSFYRKGVLEFLLYTKSKHKEIDLFLFTTWDRFSRNGLETMEMIENLKKLNIEIQAISQPVKWGEPKEKLILSIYLAIPLEENNRSKKIQ